MLKDCVNRLLLVVCCAVMALAMNVRAATVMSAGDLLSEAVHVPRDVDVFVRLIDGRAARLKLGDRAIGDALMHVLETGDAHAAWSGLAEAAGLDSMELFDGIAGHSLTVAARRRAEGWDWIVIAKNPAVQGRPSVARSLLRRLNPQRRVGIAGFEVVAVPEQRLRIASDADRLIIGPDRGGRLFPEVLERMGAGTPRGGSLLDDQEIVDAANRLGSGTLFVMMRHPRPLGGWSVIAGQTDGRRIGLHHRAHFEQSPFAEPPSRRVIDTAPLAAFEDRFLLAMLQPADTRFIADDFLSAATGSTILSAALRRVCGARRIVCIGERDARDAGGEGDLLRPTVAVAIESSGEGQDEDELDRHLERMATRLLQHGVAAGQPARLLHVGQGLDEHDRHVDLSPVEAVIADAFPLLERMSLNWTVAESAIGRYWVIATDPRHLRDTVRALESAPAGKVCPHRTDEPISGCGVFHGPRVAEHLRSWAGEALRRAPDEPGAAEQLERTLRLLASLSAGVERGRWRLRRPGELEMVLCIELDLVPPVSDAPR